MKLRSQFAVAASAVALAACATTPSPTRPAQPTQPTQPTVSFALRLAQFSDLPDWGSVDLGPALTAFKRTCSGRAAASADRSISDAGRYGGTVGEWSPACSAALSVQPGGERSFFEANFTPYVVQGAGEARLTAYFEPVVQARRQPDAYYSEPIMRRPGDMVTIDVAAFADAYDDDTLRGAPRRLTGQLVGNRVVPYPARQNITPGPGQAFAYAQPIDVYNLQVQGSGRLAFPDGAQERANFSAQNGYRWRSALGALRELRPAARGRNLAELQGLERSARAGGHARGAQRRSILCVFR